MIYGSVCSGIEAATVAWHPLGWEPAWFSQFDPEYNYEKGPDFPSAVLKHHYAGVSNLGDMTKIYENKTFQDKKIDILVGGTPCQSFSLAGARGGLDDPRGDLALEFLRIAGVKRPRWFLWENVPGVLSSCEGRDFGAFLGAVQKCGYGFAYRVLDAQHFGVPQRRRRVFVVGYLGDWKPAAAVLFDGQNVLRDTPTLEEGDESQETTYGARAGAQGGSERDLKRKAATIKAGYYKCYNDNENMDNLIIGRKGTKTTIRRLTPRECELLQGFPPDYTRISWKNRSAEKCPDGLRYKAVGNSMAVPVMRWIGTRIAAVDSQQR